MNVLRESVDIRLNKALDVLDGVFYEGTEIHSVDQSGGHVCPVRGLIGSIGTPPPRRGQIIPLSTANLRIEHSQKCRLEVFVGRTIKGDFITVHHPVQVAPHFAPVQTLRAIGFR